MDVRKIIEMSLKQLGVLAAGESAQGDELKDALFTLEGLLAQWATSRLYVHKIQDVTIPLTRGIGQYTVGVQPDYTKYEVEYDDVLPDVDALIHEVFSGAILDDEPITLVRDTNTSKSDAQVVYTKNEPYWVFDVKKAGSLLKIKTQSLPVNLDIHDELILTVNYQRPLILTLAVELAPLFGVEPTQMLMRNQMQAVELLKRSNVTPLYAKNDLPVGIGFGSI